MSKKEYADQTRTYTAYFRAGEHQERERILALIDEKMKRYDSEIITADLIENCRDSACRELLKELKEELTKK